MIKKHINFNTEKRTNAANSFEKVFLKLMISTSICLISVTILKIQRFLIRLIKSYWQNERRVWRKNNWWVCWIKVKNVFYKSIDDKESSTATWVNIRTQFNEFKDTLFNQKVLRHKMRRIQSKKHKMGPYVINKTSLSYFDDKRFVSNDGIHTLAYFHKELRK